MESIRNFLWSCANKYYFSFNHLPAMHTTYSAALTVEGWRCPFIIHHVVTMLSCNLAHNFLGKESWISHQVMDKDKKSCSASFKHGEGTLVIVHPDIMIAQIFKKTVLVFTKAKARANVDSDNELVGLVSRVDGLESIIEGCLVLREFAEINGLPGSIYELYIVIVFSHLR